MRRRDLLRRSASALLAALVAAQAGAPVRAQSRPAAELVRLSVQRTDEGLLLAYDVRLELPREVEDALNKGVALVFLVQAEVFRSRWYWSDKLRATAVRRWRLAYQPLTRRWRISIDGLGRYYNSLPEALDVMRRTTHWRIADPLSANDDQSYYVDFVFRLDTTELPRPLQIGLGGQTEWDMVIQRRLGVPGPR